MSTRHWIVVAVAGCAAMSSPAWAGRDTGWEFGVDGIYQGSKDLSFEGGSTASAGDDFGLGLTFGYRLNSNLEFEFALDWQKVNYDATIQSADVPALTANVSGDYEAFTPRLNVNYNFMDGNITPYVSGGIGWSFIDTNIPNGRVEVGCWWDPWYGQICVPVQDTRSADGFTYNFGAGVRWDTSNSMSWRLGYEKHWYEFDHASGTPDFDQFKLGVIFRY